MLEHCDCKIVFTSAEHEARMREALADVTRPVEVRRDRSGCDPGLFAEERAAAFDAGRRRTIRRSSCTRRARPACRKACCSRTRNLLAAGDLRGVVARADAATTACLCVAAALSHQRPVIATVTPFVSGGSIVTPQRFSVSHVVGSRRGVSMRRGSTWCRRSSPTCLNAAESTPRLRVLCAVRFGRSASAPLPPEQHRAFERMLRHPGDRGDGHDRIGLGRILQSAGRRAAQVRETRVAAAASRRR